MERLSKTYFRDSLLGALGAMLMLVGDLCLSVIPANQGDSGLFLREAYFNGTYPPWRLQLLLATGIAGMALGFFSVRVCREQVLPQYRRTRTAINIGGAVYLVSACALHYMIGSFADWTSRLAPLLGRTETAGLIQAQYERIMPAAMPAYAGMVLLMLASAWAVLTKKTMLPRGMFLFHALTIQLVMVLIPDLRMAMGAEISTWDFVISQCSGNAGLMIWMAANAVWAKKQTKHRSEGKGS